MWNIACARSQQYTNDSDFLIGTNYVVSYDVT